MGGLMMKMVKSAILAAAGIFAVAGTAYAADLPVRKAPEKVFVEVCTNYEGYYRIPGTDTCVRIGGYVRMDWGVGGGTTATPNFPWSRESGLSNQFTRWVMVFDARPMTDVGPARIYANVIAGNVTTGGAGYTGGTQWTAPTNSIIVQLAYIQLHGWEFGYNYSTFDYLHTQYLMHVMVGGSDRWITGIRYTAGITKELQATIAIEDSGARRQPIDPWNVGSGGLSSRLLNGLCGARPIGRTGGPLPNAYPRSAKLPRRPLYRRLGRQVIFPEMRRPPAIPRRMGRLRLSWVPCMRFGRPMRRRLLRPSGCCPVLLPPVASRSRFQPSPAPLALASSRPTRRSVVRAGRPDDQDAGRLV